MTENGKKDVVVVDLTKYPLWLAFVISWCVGAGFFAFALAVIGIFRAVFE